MSDANGAPAPTEAIVRRAIAWHMHLASASAAERPRLLEEVDRWCDEQPDHALAWRRVAGMSAELDDITQRLPTTTEALSILDRGNRELARRRALKLMLTGCAVGGAGLWLSPARLPWQADYTTAIGERRRISLSDGTRVTLNTDSALDVAFDNDQRRLVLARGEVLVESGSDVASLHHRPLRLACRHGICEALGTRFSVRDTAATSRLHVSAGRVALDQPGTTRQIVVPGETVRFDGATTTPVAAPALDPDAWSRGMLVVNDIRLDKFLAELARYRLGFVGCDEHVAGLRLSGVYQLDDQSALLRHLTRTLPIKVVSRTRWWIRVEPA
ncbi:FecR domain-containing protein [Salinicola sp. DM10]|uniref:FecR domain-containing protein n=1 Tax=Salinicola sp. DM10 TaxID=2815721 RepID=UPI001A8CE740|nr:FecR family protein [Salinicola sp. DM10]MCE3028746.1 FecR family protein [Salinicola sp. DM10]